MNKIKCRCGCLVEIDDIVCLNVRIKGKLTKRKVCPNHKEFPGGEQLSRVFSCQDCGKLVTVGLKAGRMIRCPSCQKIANLTTITDSNRKTREMKKNKFDPEIKKKAALLKKINDKNNPFHCMNFHLCGSCIKPHFECKMFEKYKGEI